MSVLQNNYSQSQTNYSQSSVRYDHGEPSLDLGRYFAAFKKHWLLGIIPAVLILAIGIPIVLLKPATFLSSGKILIESQQIPAELVRPTVTATAAARVQVIEQRVMTRDNLLGVVNKFQLLAGERNWLRQPVRLSGTEALDKMRSRTQITPIALDLPRQRINTNNTMAFSVSFEHESPELAARVANELVTLILAEDARNRTNRASETTQFLLREQKRLEVDLGSVDAQIADLKQKNQDIVAGRSLEQLAMLKSELQQKAVIYSPSHPALKPIQLQIAALEKLAARSSEFTATSDLLERQRAAVQKNLDDIAEKLMVARRGEALERNQQSERLEVIEQPVVPTTPVRGNRLKFLAVVFAVAFASGVGAPVAIEMMNRTVRSAFDLARVIDSDLIVGIPYIVTKHEKRRSRRRFVGGATSVVVLALLAVAAIHLLWIPLEQVWDKILIRFAG